MKPQPHQTALTDNDRVHHILVVEDDEGLNRLIRKNLDREGFDTEHAVTGKQALEKIANNQDALLLLDYKLPDTTAERLIHQLIQDDKQLPFIIMTGHGDEHVAVEMMKLGARDYIVKEDNFIEFLPQKVKKVSDEIVKERKLAFAEQRLRENERKTMTLLSNLPGMAYRCKNAPNWTIEFVSEGCRELTGYEPNDMVDDNVIAYGDIIHPEDRDSVWKKVQEAVKKRNHFELEYRIITKDKKEKWVWERGISVSYHKEEIEILEGFISDITQRKKAEEALKESERRLKQAQRVAHIGHWELDPQVGTPIWSEEIFHIFGLDPEKSEPSFVDHETYVHSDDWPLLNDSVTRAGKDGTPFDIEFRIVRPDKEVRWMHAIGTTIRDEKGSVVKIFGTAQDITERKQAEEALAEREKKYREIFNNANDAMYMHKLTDEGMPGRFVEVNDVACNMLGYTREEFMEMSPQDIDAPDVTNEVPGIMKTLHEQGHVTLEMKHIAKDGDHIPVEISSHLFTLNNERLILSIARDITERKQAEQALRDREEKYRTFFDTSRDAVFITSKDGKWLDMNDAAVELFGYNSKEELQQEKIPDLYANPEDREEHIKKIEHEGYTKDRPTELKRKDGSIIDTLITTVPVRDEDGNVIALQGTIRDVTEQKKAERALRESEAKYRGLFNSALAGITVHDSEGNITATNEKAQEIFGFSEDELIKKDVDFWVGKLINPDGLPMQISDFPISIVAKSKEPYEGKTVGLLMSEKENVRWFLHSARPILDDKGNIDKVVTSFVEITDRKKMEEELKIKDKSINSSISAIALSDLEGKLTFVNPSFLKMWGYHSEKEVLGKSVISFWKNQKKAKEASNKSLENNSWQGELIAKKKDGSTFTVLTSANLVLDQKSKPLYKLASFIDITERKKAEQEREEYLREMKLITDIVVTSSRMEDADEMCRLIGKTIQAINKKSYVAVSLYDPELDGVRIRSMNGFQKHIDRLFELVGGDLTKFVFRPDEMGDAKKAYTTGKLERITGGLYVLMEKKVPKKVCQAIEKMLNIEEAYTVGFALGNEPNGGIIILPQKGEEIRFKSAIETIASHFSVITQRKQAEKALRESEKEYRDLVENANEAIIVIQDGMLKFFNPKAEEIAGYSKDELITKPFHEFIHPDDREMVCRRHQRRLKGENFPDVYPFRFIHKNGDIRWVEINAVRISWDNKPATLNFISDITERKKAEEEKESLQNQLIQSQKMEAVGRLAGGVAHDFNNLLTVINGYSNLLLMDLDQEHTMRKDLKEISDAGKRAADLTRQLLAFSRRQILELKVVNLNSIIQDLKKMLRRLIGEDIRLVTEFEENLGNVKADPGQMEQVIINLAVNARDAMPQGGTITIETDNVELDEEYASHHVPVEPGHYVRMSISDTGVGMSEGTRQQIFEPFFTTKEKGKGTGLGLSTVYGIVKQSGGYIWVYSEPDKGTVFKLYLPRVEEQIKTKLDTKTEKHLYTGSETVLVVEDDPKVLNTTRKMLKSKGYTVYSESDADEAIKIFREQADVFDLVITDVVMPNKDGKELAEEILSEKPDVKILYISGYADDAIVHHGVLEEGTQFLQKPFTPEQLARKVREVLEEKEASEKQKVESRKAKEKRKKAKEKL